MKTDTPALTIERVEAVFVDCLFREEEDTSNHVRADGIVRSVGFHPDRLEAHSEEIVELLAELPDAFQQSSGGGMSFLNACFDKHDNQWTDVHFRMEQLLLLGLATGRVEYLAPRELWSAFPGGMPYFVVKNG